MDVLDYYQILGVTENATDAEIKAAFKKKAVKYHPDKHRGDSSMENIFKELNNAYQVLSNPYKRTRYDMNLKYGQFEVTVDPPKPERPVRRRPPIHATIIKEQPFNSKENIKATFYAFMFAFTVALLIKSGIWVHEYLVAQELAKVLAERRQTYDIAKVEIKEGRIAEGLLILDDMGSFTRTELDIRDYKDQMIQEILQKGHEYFENGNYASAIANYELLEKYPVSGSLNLLFNKAEAYKKIGDFSAAIKMFNEMYQMGYNSASFYYNFAKLYEEGPKNHTTALRYYKIAAEEAVSGYESGIGKAYPIVINANMIPSFHYDIYIKLANAYYLNKEYKQTIKSVEWTKEIWPDSAYQYELSGRSNLALGNNASACSEFKIASSLGSKFVRPSICN